MGVPKAESSFDRLAKTVGTAGGAARGPSQARMTQGRQRSFRHKADSSAARLVRRRAFSWARSSQRCSSAGSGGGAVGAEPADDPEATEVANPKYD